MVVLNIKELSLPLEDPVLKFLVVLIIILAAPLLLNRIKVPHLLGLIIAGAIIGPNGFNLLSRDSSIVVTGTTGLLYIMFLAGLEIDMGDFKKNKWKSLTFGLYTFIIPFALGYLAAIYILNFQQLTSILFASLFSSQTLISYPIVSKIGVTKNPAVNITIGGTMITDILALLVLAVVVGMSQGEVGSAFWTKLSVSFVIFSVIVLFIFPIIGRWFFKKVQDKISQYIFVLVMIYLAALLAELAGIEAIIGAFFAGLALNRLIPHTSSLMNRVDFVGNAIFIPFFLISVGMLIDFNVFFKSWETILVALIMLIASIGGKYIAAIATQKTFRLSKDEGKLIFGLSSASAAATLASVMVGYNIILSETETGEPIRLLNEHVLNGSILLILVSCTISSFVTASSSAKIAEEENDATISGTGSEEENLLLPILYPNTIEKSVNLSLLIKAPNNKENIFALNIINDEKNESSEKNAEKILAEAINLAAAADIVIQPLKRYDTDALTGINNVIKEKNISDILLVLQDDKGFSPSFVYNLYNGYLLNNTVNVMVYHAAQPVSTIKKYLVLLPPKAHLETGFFHALFRIWNLSKNSGATIEFYATKATIDILERVNKKTHIEATFSELPNWRNAEDIIKNIGENETLVLMMAKQGMQSFIPIMRVIPNYLNRFLKTKNYFLIYPHSDSSSNPEERRSVTNHGDFAEIGNIIKKVFRY